MNKILDYICMSVYYISAHILACLNILNMLIIDLSSVYLYGTTMSKILQRSSHILCYLLLKYLKKQSILNSKT